MKNNHFPASSTLHPETDYLKNSLRTSLSAVIILLFSGVLGYRFFFDHSWVDAFFMTIITVGTVGYGEVVPLTEAGKLFTSFLILFSLVLFAYALTTISAYLVSKYSFQDDKLKKMQQEINKLSGHVIVCGYGRNGREAAATLAAYGKSVVVIEANHETATQLQQNKVLCIEANATDDNALQEAGIGKATHLITTLPLDTDNVFIALSARQLNPGINICSRASEEANVKKLKIAGVNHVIMPDKIGGSHLASMVVSPDLVEFLDNLSSSPAGAMLVQEIALKKHPNVNFLSELRIKEKTGCTVIGYKTETGEYIINPEIHTPVNINGRIIVLGNKSQMETLHREFGTFRENHQ